MSEYAYFFTQGEATAENIVKCKFCSEDVPQKKPSLHLHGQTCSRNAGYSATTQADKQKHAAEGSGAGSTSQQPAKEKIEATIKGKSITKEWWRSLILHKTEAPLVAVVPMTWDRPGQLSAAEPQKKSRRITELCRT